ncbi:MAG: 23S rRNA (guanosine(2251)-2'-O)-methyltransferase RlmB [Candidatus Obscuribacterales bacterium]|nr:23S rRNA (guanosine(2251)-2'-O)-methyltransferase RlmB [Candidatus Obscuribacterales bacterium]
MINSDEMIFGKNAVLSFLEQAESARDGEKGPLQTFADEGQVLSALSSLKVASGGESIKLPDLRELKRLSGIKINKILIQNGMAHDGRIDSIKDLAKSQRVPVQFCEKRKLDQLVGPDKRHQGVLALISAAEMWPLEAFLVKLELDRQEAELAGKNLDGYMVAVADGIEDPHNLGAIIRTAEAAGVKALLVPQRRATGLTSTVAKISAGAIASLPVVRVSNLVFAMETLKKFGFWVVGLDVYAEEMYCESDLKRPLAVVIGSEGQGMSRLMKEHCDFLVRLPMLGKVESLNASVAAGILFYEVVRQNMPSGVSGKRFKKPQI